ncbi:hypothetical protein, partial [Klebsiella pneumoniae]|uniref:hypothetical protein n=1 Tax=Klebsiella pneumoniae TaxID=573 RepID=UPI001C6FB9BC
MKGMTVIVLMWEEAAIKDDVIEYDIAFNIIYIMRTSAQEDGSWRSAAVTGLVISLRLSRLC